MRGWQGTFRLPPVRRLAEQHPFLPPIVVPPLLLTISAKGRAPWLPEASSGQVSFNHLLCPSHCPPPFRRSRPSPCVA